MHVHTCMLHACTMCMQCNWNDDSLCDDDGNLILCDEFNRKPQFSDRLKQLLHDVFVNKQCFNYLLLILSLVFSFSLAMMKPDRQLIAQVMLYSQGFRTAEILASKIVPFFK